MNSRNLWADLIPQPFYFGGSPSPPPIIIPPAPPPPPPMPDIGSQQKLESERAKLAAQLRTGRTSTDLTDPGGTLRGGLNPLGGGPPGAAIASPAAPPYTGVTLGGPGGAVKK